MSNITEEKQVGQTCSTVAKTCSSEAQSKIEVKHEEKAGQCSENKVNPEGTTLAVKKAADFSETRPHHQRLTTR